GPLCRALGIPELENDPRFNTDEKKFENAEELVAIFDEIFMTRPLDAWLRIFDENDLFCCGINELMELENDPQVMENDYLIDFEHPALGKVKMPGYPVHFSESWAQTTSAAPELGEHTEEVLTGLAGLREGEIEGLRKQGVV
ncbi:MAG: CoA transferase, partial [Deltaproteobacteria bacterium]|nr:CoA transferase [Deltaproteobacteria bacterium]